LEVAGRPRERISAGDLGFAVGPRLNAAGRLDDMALGISCLLTDSDLEAQAMARQLDQLNRERRSIETQMQEQALTALADLPMDDGATLSAGLCLFDEAWHQGVIGILASRIKDRWHRPVIAFALASASNNKTGEIKGSARSIPGIHIRDVLDTVAATHPGLLSKFGGHAMAAGLTLKREHYDAFSKAFDEEVRRQLGDQALQGIVLSDGELSAGDINLDLAETLRNGGPWGQGFPEPIFDGQFQVVNQRIVGEKHLKMVLKIAGDSRIFDAIAFNASDAAAFLEGSQQSHIAYKLDVNEYQGRRSVQLIVEHIVGPE
jgi:single-stranded-DNA-specific exonuclease